MDIRDVMKIPTMKEFYELRDKLNLTDRQRDIFYLKYSRGLRNIDIANELEPPVNQDLVGDELKIIRAKLATIGNESMKGGN